MRLYKISIDGHPDRNVPVICIYRAPYNQKMHRSMGSWDGEEWYYPVINEDESDLELEDTTWEHWADATWPIYWMYLPKETDYTCLQK